MTLAERKEIKELYCEIMKSDIKYSPPHLQLNIVRTRSSIVLRPKTFHGEVTFDVT
jgi:hypothetical protein